MADFSSLRWVGLLAVRAGWAPVGVVALFLWLSAIGKLAEFDSLVHGLGGASMAFVAYVGLSMRPDAARSERGRTLFAFGIACLIAAIWEIAEFVADRTLGTSMQHGTRETVGDLVSGFVGAAAVTIIVKTIDSIRRNQL